MKLSALAAAVEAEEQKMEQQAPRAGDEQGGESRARSGTGSLSELSARSRSSTFGEHRLQNRYCFSVRPSGKNATSHGSYESSIKKVGDFHSVEQFWSIYSHMQRPTSEDIGRTMDIHLFKDGIRVSLICPYLTLLPLS